MTSVTAGSPRVSVPVLSNAIARTAARRSRCAPPLMSTPLRAAADSADTIDTGVEMTSAHGHEITSSTSDRYSHVDTSAPATSGGTTGHERGQHDHGRRVDPREAIDEGLHRRASRLRGFDQMDDARQSRVGPDPRHLDLERAAAVDRARIGFVAGPLVHRERLTSHRRFVDVAVAGHDPAVERAPCHPAAR